MTATCLAGDAYDLAPDLWSDGNCPGTKFIGVGGTRRISLLQVNLAKGAGLAATIAAEREELPPDARAVWQVTRPHCTLTEYRSQQLADLNSSEIPDGGVLANASTNADGYWYAMLIWDNTTEAATAPTCE